MSVSSVTLKVVLLGEGRVGKTSLSSKYVSNLFDAAEPPTSAAAYTEKQVVIDGVTARLALWDTAGQERFHALGPIYYRNADAAVLVFDITDTHSYRRIQSWVAELRQMVGRDVPLTILANKQDLASSRVVPDDQARAFAAAVGAQYYRTSAKTGAGIEQAFLDTAKAALQHHRKTKAKQHPSSLAGGISQPQQLTWSSSMPHQRSSGCC